MPDPMTGYYEGLPRAERVEVITSVQRRRRCDPNDIMYPNVDTAVGLSAGDIAGIQALYGPETRPDDPPVVVSDLDARNEGGREARLSARTVVQGTNVTVVYAVTNWGWGGNASGSTAGIYLSIDSVFDAGDTLLTTDAVRALAANTVSAESAVIATSGIAAGNYFIFVVADYNRVITEGTKRTTPRTRSR